VCERQDADNFVFLGSGTTGNSFFFKDDKRFSIAPSSVVTGVSPDVPNSIFFYGSEWPTAANAGNYGIGTDAPTEKLHVVGNIFASGTITPSDSRLKTVIKNDVEFGLDAVMSLNVIEFEYNGLGGTKKNDRHFGLLAQELQKAAPSLVEEYTDVEYKYTELQGSQHQEYVGETTYLSIKDSEIKYLLMNAIQDQQQIIINQENRIADLENALVEIRGLLANNTAPINVAPSSSSVATLGQNEPNPFSDRTSISYTIPEGSTDASLRIFSVAGQLIETVQITQTGSGKVQLDNTNLTNGTYTYQLIVDGRIVDTNKMISQR